MGNCSLSSSPSDYVLNVCCRSNTKASIEIVEPHHKRSMSDCPYKLVTVIPNELLFNNKNEEKLGEFNCNIPEDFCESVRMLTVQIGQNTYYEGSFDKSWNMSGFGKLYTSLYSYTGSFNDGKFNGKGRLIEKSGNSFQGDFENGLTNGKGLMIDKVGNIYAGFFEKGEMKGYSKINYKIGNTYEGSVLNGRKHGNGRLSFSSNDSYEGEFVDDVFEGFGEYSFSNGRNYKGFWSNGKMQGIGLFTWPDGKWYIGQYHNDVKEGIGAFFWTKDMKYVGEWKNGKQEGLGIIYKSGKEKFGIWEDGAQKNLLRQGKEEIVNRFNSMIRDSKVNRIDENLCSFELTNLSETSES